MPLLVGTLQQLPLHFFPPSLSPCALVHPPSEKPRANKPPDMDQGLRPAAGLPTPTEGGDTFQPQPHLVKRPASPCRAVVRALRLVAPLSAEPPHAHTLLCCCCCCCCWRRGMFLCVCVCLPALCSGRGRDSLCVGMEPAHGSGGFPLFILHIVRVSSQSC